MVQTLKVDVTQKSDDELVSYVFALRQTSDEVKAKIREVVQEQERREIGRKATEAVSQMTNVELGAMKSATDSELNKIRPAR